MTAPNSANRALPPRSRKRAVSKTALESDARQPIFTAAMNEAEAAGLLAGTTEHVSFHAPSTVARAAMQRTGVPSVSELGMLALATLAQPDPVASFFKRTHGRLGPDHDLDF